MLISCFGHHLILLFNDQILLFAQEYASMQVSHRRWTDQVESESSLIIMDTLICLK